MASGVDVAVSKVRPGLFCALSVLRAVGNALVTTLLYTGGCGACLKLCVSRRLYGNG